MCSGAVVKTFTSIVRVCDRGVLKYKQSRQVDKNSPMRIGGQASKAGIDMLNKIGRLGIPLYYTIPNFLYFRLHGIWSAVL